MKKTLLMVALAMLTMMSGYAQDSLQVKNMVHAMVKKYESVKGVDCVTIENIFGSLNINLTKNYERKIIK